MSLAGPSATRAERLSIGASIGASKSEGGTDRISARSVFARLQVSPRLSIEGELGGVELEANDARDTLDFCARSSGCGTTAVVASGKLARATVRLDLGKLDAALRPHLLAGGGVESWDRDFTTFRYSRQELGAGVDLRLTQGLRLGADVRLGHRELVDERASDDVVIAIAIYILPPLPEAATRYTTARVTLSASF